MGGVMLRLSANTASGCLMVHHCVVWCVFSGPLCVVAITLCSAWCITMLVHNIGDGGQSGAADLRAVYAARGSQRRHRYAIILTPHQ
jgi:hypothetical protein